MIPLLAAAGVLDSLGAFWKGATAANPAPAADPSAPAASGPGLHFAAQHFATLLSAHGIDAGADAARLTHAAAGRAAT